MTQKISLKTLSAGESLSCLSSHRPDWRGPVSRLTTALLYQLLHNTVFCWNAALCFNLKFKDRELFTQKECRCHSQRLENSPINSQKLVIFLPDSVLPRNKHGKIFPEQGKLLRVVKLEACFGFFLYKLQPMRGSVCVSSANQRIRDQCHTWQMMTSDH